MLSPPPDFIREPRQRAVWYALMTLSELYEWVDGETEEDRGNSFLDVLIEITSTKGTVQDLKGS